MCMWAAYSVLAICGLINPLKWLPIVMFEIFYKIIWLVVVAYPLWSTHQLAGSPAEGMTRAFLWVHSADRGDALELRVQDQRLAVKEDKMIPVAGAQATRFLRVRTWNQPLLVDLLTSRENLRRSPESAGKWPKSSGSSATSSTARSMKSFCQPCIAQPGGHPHAPALSSSEVPVQTRT